jgi:hypothetical protein
VGYTGPVLANAIEKREQIRGQFNDVAAALLDIMV